MVIRTAVGPLTLHLIARCHSGSGLGLALGLVTTGNEGYTLEGKGEGTGGKTKRRKGRGYREGREPGQRRIRLVVHYKPCQTRRTSATSNYSRMSLHD